MRLDRYVGHTVTEPELRSRCIYNTEREIRSGPETGSQVSTTYAASLSSSLSACTVILGHDRPGNRLHTPCGSASD